MPTLASLFPPFPLPSISRQAHLPAHSQATLAPAVMEITPVKWAGENMHPQRLSNLQQGNALPRSNALPQGNAFPRGNALPQVNALPPVKALPRANPFPQANNPLPFGAASPPRAPGTTRGTATNPFSGGIMNPPPAINHRSASVNPLAVSSSNQKQP